MFPLPLNNYRTILRLDYKIIDDEKALKLQGELKRCFQQCPTLTTLSINSCDLSATRAWRVINGVEGARYLQYLSLNENSLRDCGVKYFEFILPTLKSLRSLSLRDNGIGIEGALSLLRALQNNPSITELDLEENPIPVHMLAKIDSLLHGRRSLQTLCWKVINENQLLPNRLSFYTPHPCKCTEHRYSIV